MGHETHTPDTAQPVLPMPPARPTLNVNLSTAAESVPAEPRPITISPASSLTIATLPPPRPVNSPVAARTVPISAPQADMSTTAAGTPRPETRDEPTLTEPTLTEPLPERSVSGPEFSEVVRSVVDQETSRFLTGGPQHPMAHLMPERTKPTEAQIRAAELRAANKKKSRRAKVLVVVSAVGLGFFAGPPLAAWVVDAVNESGSTTDEPNRAPTAGDNTSDNTGVDHLLDDFNTPTSVASDNNASTED